MQKMLVMKQIIEVVEAYSPIQERLADDSMQEAKRDGARSTSANCEFGQLNFSTSANFWVFYFGHFFGVRFRHLMVGAPRVGFQGWGPQGGGGRSLSGSLVELWPRFNAMACPWCPFALLRGHCVIVGPVQGGPWEGSPNQTQWMKEHL